jgi:hypothetical protein
MFGTLEGTVDQAREQRRAARRRELDAMRADEARKEQRKPQIVREDDDWRDAGCSSSVQWFMQLYACDYRTAPRIVRASHALRRLPALDEALAAGELTLDQAVAAAEVATPETDAELARIAIGKAPREIERIARIIVPRVVTRCASYAQLRALIKRSGHCQYPGCTARRELQAHHIVPAGHGGETVIDNLILLCPRHHKLLHDHHISTSGNGDQPAFEDANGRAITTNQPHAPPR